MLMRFCRSYHGFSGQIINCVKKTIGNAMTNQTNNTSTMPPTQV